MTSMSVYNLSDLVVGPLSWFNSIEKYWPSNTHGNSCSFSYEPSKEQKESILGKYV